MLFFNFGSKKRIHHGFHTGLKWIPRLTRVSSAPYQFFHNSTCAPQNQPVMLLDVRHAHIQNKSTLDMRNIQFYTICYLRAYYCGQYCNRIAIDSKQHSQISVGQNRFCMHKRAVYPDINDGSRAEIPRFTSVLCV